MRMTEIGGSMSSLVPETDSIQFHQGAFAYRIDDFVGTLAPPPPNYLKIDVDGIEDLIIAGAAHTLADPRLRSVMVELSLDQPDKVASVTTALEKAGLRLFSRRHAAMFDTTQFQNVYNFRFDRA